MNLFETSRGHEIMERILRELVKSNELKEKELALYNEMMALVRPPIDEDLNVGLDDEDWDEDGDPVSVLSLEIGFNPYMGCYDYDC